MSYMQNMHGGEGRGLELRTAGLGQRPLLFLTVGCTSFHVLHFGLCNAPATFQRLMNTVLAGILYKLCAVSLNDIVVASLIFEQHLRDLEEVLARLRTAGLSIKLDKCQFCR